MAVAINLPHYAEVYARRLYGLYESELRRMNHERLTCFVAEKLDILYPTEREIDQVTMFLAGQIREHAAPVILTEADQGSDDGLFR